MFNRWFKNYQALMLKTRLLSQFAAFLLLVLAIVDLVGVGRGIAYAENIGWETVWNGTIPAVAFILGFGTRFGVLFSKNRFGTLAMAASWWIVFFAVMMAKIISYRSCWIDCQVDPNISVSYSYYDPLNDPLVPAGLLFIFLSFFRFVITAAGAFLYRK
jgi:hypothetical protein